MKFIKEVGNLRPILGTQTFFWPLTHPPTHLLLVGRVSATLKQWPAPMWAPAMVQTSISGRGGFSRIFECPVPFVQF